ncbi:nitroreductase family protein [Barrientosiimonas marina]|uniref:Nitroreductase family protein n=1 Tax=Lentibacillus kimchii TaxID=1542911 RepID=A0ABW2USJ0_9BACI
MVSDFYHALTTRHSYYELDKNIQISDEKIQEIVEFAVAHTPSAFNSQTARLVVLLGDEHDKLWAITTERLKREVGDNDFSNTQKKMDAFQAGYGTVLFFEDQSVVQRFQNDFALYADKFPIWSSEASGMHQLVVWTALESEGLGASLQHYNPLIDDEVKETWNIPDHWALHAQMPFGNPTSSVSKKDMQPIADRVKVYK